MGRERGEGGQGSAFTEDEEAVEGVVEEDLADAALGRWLQLRGSNSRQRTDRGRRGPGQSCHHPLVGGEGVHHKQMWGVIVGLVSVAAYTTLPTTPSWTHPL